MISLGLSIEQTDVSGQVDPLFEGWSAKSWREQMQTVAEATGFYLGKFREIEAAAPAGEVEVARAMVKHETAINVFAKRELAGDERNSVDLMVAELAHPLPAPTAVAA
ncbi:MAG TPA: hypothetical protein VGS12_11700 [Caulobacteraceae bacterium]|nr:hypothetical protein [Caulobacteraceae bacterium]